ncbi:hypothetical protein EDF62_0599 [Leucobacter luti]|uniref:Uncharacterized protein n=1 Tax=Leucobacter luti TaxID=340320 RepID=A0A4R6SAK9_9MICO|nr:hypothetical protein EDF62_0599 [Leucobacter luti]
MHVSINILSLVTLRPALLPLGPICNKLLNPARNTRKMTFNGHNATGIALAAHAEPRATRVKFACVPEEPRSPPQPPPSPRPRPSPSPATLRAGL